MSLLSSLFGSGGSGDYANALETLKNVPLPILQELDPEAYQQVVRLNPELEQAATLGPSSMEGVSTDPRLKQAQMNALLKLQEIGDEGGMTIEDRGRLSSINNEVNANLKGNQDAIVQNMAVRGMSGGPMEAVMRQNAAQAAANTASQQGFDVHATAQKRALDALMQAGQLGSQMQSQDFNQQSQVAQAKDAIDRFNNQNTQQVRNNNVATNNQAQQWNATNQQNVANQNTELRNNTQQYNKNLAQQQFNNQMTKAGAVANGYGNVAQSKDKNRDAEMALVGNLIGAGASAYGGYKAGK